MAKLNFEKSKWFDPEKDAVQPANTTGDTSVKNIFSGGPYGHSNRKQLALPRDWDGLEDEKDSKWFGVKFPTARSFKAMIYEDEILPEELTEINVNDPSTSGYRDLPGFNTINALVDPQKQVPPDRDKHRRSREDVKDNIRIDLVPDGQDDKEPDWYGNGPMEKTKIVTEKNSKNMKKNSSNKSNPWSNIGHGGKKDFKFNQLAAHKEYVTDDVNNLSNEEYLIDMEDGVETRPGIMGSIVKPYGFVPDGETVKESKDKKDDVQTLMDRLNPWKAPEEEKGVQIVKEFIQKIVRKEIRRLR